MALIWDPKYLYPFYTVRPTVLDIEHILNHHQTFDFLPMFSQGDSILIIIWHTNFDFLCRTWCIPGTVNRMSNQRNLFLSFAAAYMIISIGLLINLQQLPLRSITLLEGDIGGVHNGSTVFKYIFPSRILIILHTSSYLVLYRPYTFR